MNEEGKDKDKRPDIPLYSLLGGVLLGLDVEGVALMGGHAVTLMLDGMRRFVHDARNIHHRISEGVSDYEGICACVHEE